MDYNYNIFSKIRAPNKINKLFVTGSGSVLTDAEIEAKLRRYTFDGTAKSIMA